MNKDDCTGKRIVNLILFQVCEKPVKEHYLKQHMKTHTVEMIKCSKCKCSFKNEQTLASHVLSIHNPQPKVLVRCGECDKVFNNERVLKQHISKNHREEKFQCDECKMMFVTRGGLRRHKQNHMAIADFLLLST